MHRVLSITLLIAFASPPSALKSYECKEHQDCPIMTLEDCGGELCAPRHLPYCDHGKCRSPRSISESRIACIGKSPSSHEVRVCLDLYLEKLVNKVGILGAFKECNASFRNSDEAEACRLGLCGYHPIEGSLGDPKCVARARSSSCKDGRQNGRESAIDCGGPDCPPCKEGASCERHSDCASGICGLHGISNRGKCYRICGDGPISEHEPCGCVQETTPQGVRRTPEPNDHDVGTSRQWESQYGDGKRVFCCAGREYYLRGGENCLVAHPSK